MRHRPIRLSAVVGLSQSGRLRGRSDLNNSPILDYSSPTNRPHRPPPRPLARRMDSLALGRGVFALVLPLLLVTLFSLDALLLAHYCWALSLDALLRALLLVALHFVPVLLAHLRRSGCDRLLGGGFVYPTRNR